MSDIEKKRPWIKPKLVEEASYVPIDLRELEIGPMLPEARAANMDSIRELQVTPQSPHDFDRFFEKDDGTVDYAKKNSISSIAHLLAILRETPHAIDEISEALIKEMQASGIKKIVHTEGKTVWDHTKSAIKKVDELDISDVVLGQLTSVATSKEELKSLLKLLMLHHDIGKKLVWDNDTNIVRTRKHISEGEMVVSTIGHSDDPEVLKLYEERLRANGLEGRKLELCLFVLENHMTKLDEMQPENVYELLVKIGENDKERIEALQLLMLVLHLDGEAAESIEIKERKKTTTAEEYSHLKFSGNEKKLKITFDAVWKRYEEGKRMVDAKIAKELQKKEDEVLEQKVFGMKLTGYIESRGIPEGPVYGKIQKVFRSSRKLSPEEIKVLIDAEIAVVEKLHVK